MKEKVMGRAAPSMSRSRVNSSVMIERSSTHPVVQEQILRVAREIAGLSWAEADHLRRGMSKIQVDEMAPIQNEFIRGCQRPAPDGPAFTPKQAGTLWEQVVAFGRHPRTLPDLE